MRRFKIILFFTCITDFQLVAQTALDSFNIREFNSAHYKLASRNYMGLAGPDQKIYFANENGLLQYDGSKWKLYTIKDYQTVLSIAFGDDGLMYVGSSGELGYIRLEDGEYTSLTSLLPDSIEVGDLWQITQHDGDVYYSGYSGIFKYDGQKIISIPLKDSHVFKVGDHLVSSVFYKGLYEIKNDSAIIRNDKIFKGDDVAFTIIPDLTSEKYIFITSENGMYTLTPGTFEMERVYNQSTELIDKHYCYDAIVFRDSLYAISTWNGGLILADKNFEVLRHIKAENGLSTNELLELFNDVRGNLWIGNNNGISNIHWKKDHQGGTVKSEIVIDPILDQESSFVSFQFTTPGYDRTELVYSFYLKGFEKKFGEWTVDTKKEYTNLEGGEYTFLVKSTLPDGRITEVASYSFIIPTPWYLTTKAIIGGILTVALLFFMVYYMRTKRLKITNDRLERIISERTFELTNQQKELQGTNDRLKIINSELDNFVYRSSHDLVAPLKSLRGLINLASIDRDDHNLTAYFEQMTSSVTKLEEFIKSIMEYSVNNKVEVKNESVCFDLIIKEITEAIRYYDKADRVRIVKLYDPSIILHVDVKRLVILLSNLITNAIKYHNYEQEDPFVEIDLKKSDLESSISVRDNGLGISKEHLDNIFDMFYRASERSEGSGLGLYIVKETLKTLEGRIEVISELGVGTTFKVSIPCKEKVLPSYSNGAASEKA
ncbi:MAG: ATP-binding protein [Bacteroidota bacterium]